MSIQHPALYIACILLLSSCGKKMEETKPIRKDVTETVFASGILEASNTYSLTAQADGYLTQVNFEEGDLVNTGKVLAVVDNKQSGFNEQSAAALYDIARSNVQQNAPALLQAQNAILINKTKMEQDYVQYQRYKKLWEANSIAKIDLENTELQYKTSKTTYENSLENYRQVKQQADQQVISSKAQKKINEVVLTHNQIKAVVSGKVYKKYKQTGDYVKRGDVIALIGEASGIYAKVNVDETNIARLKPGQQAIVQLNINKEKMYKGTLAAIYPSFDEGAQSFTCKIVFTDSLDFRIAGTQLQANIIVDEQKNALLIPRNYLDFGGNVMVKGKKEPVKVVTKFVSNNWVQVLSGIDGHTTIVTDNIPANKMTTSEVGSQMH
jgi:HlyD family secretion protein